MRRPVNFGRSFPTAVTAALISATALVAAAGAAGVFAAEIFAEFIDRAQADTGEKAYPGIWGFDFDDILYLFAPVVWLDWHLYFVLGAAVGAPTFALLTWYKWRTMDR